MKLYFSPGACSLSTHIAIQELGLQLATQRVDLKTHQFGGHDYYKVNQKGSVPALELENGQVLTEAAVVLQYLADQKPEAKLVPASGSFERYRCQEWLNFIATEIHKGFGPILRPTFNDDAKAAAKEILFKKFDLLNDHLGKNEFLMGSQYTVADAYLFTTLRWGKAQKFDMSKWPAVDRFFSKVESRPAVQNVLKQEGLN